MNGFAPSGNRKKSGHPRHRNTEEEILTGARDALITIENGTCTLDDLLDDARYHNFRRILSHLLLGYFKHKKVIDSALAGFFRKTPAEKTHALLKVSLTQALIQERIAPQAVVNVAVEAAKKDKNHGFVNAVLRKALSELNPHGSVSIKDEQASTWPACSSIILTALCRLVARSPKFVPMPR